MNITKKSTLALITLMLATVVSSQAYSIERIDREELVIDNSRLSTAAQARDPHWRGNRRDNGVQLGCRGLDLIVKSVKITRYSDRGTIGIYAKVKNICRGNTSQNIRVVFDGWPGRPHAWIHGGLNRGETKGIGVVTEDYEQRNRVMGPVNVKVNHLKEITERDYSNNICHNTRLGATANVTENHCR